MTESPINKGLFLARTLAEYARPPTRARARPCGRAQRANVSVP